jgi:hypothetical protein
MKSILRLLVCFAVLSGLTTGILALQPVWLESMGMDVWSLPALHAQISTMMDRNDYLDRQAEAIKERLEIKERAIQDWAHDRISLAEAVEQFRISNEMPVAGGEQWRSLYPSANDQQALCKQFCVWAESEFRTMKNIDGSVLRARLESEANEYIKAH